MCDHEFVKVFEVPAGLEDADFYVRPVLRWQCIHCGAYEDELEDDERAGRRRGSARLLGSTAFDDSRRKD